METPTRRAPADRAACGEIPFEQLDNLLHAGRISGECRQPELRRAIICLDGAAEQPVKLDAIAARELDEPARTAAGERYSELRIFPLPHFTSPRGDTNLLDLRR